MTTPVPHHSVFTGWMPFLPRNEHRQSTESIITAFSQLKPLTQKLLECSRCAAVGVPVTLEDGWANDSYYSHHFSYI